ncbi:MAG TPA: hypothetical protein VG078_02085, partial [Acidimicrobiales bacterium]|nr:hypothetical protein [Acidimicrobiales bacterium]
RGRRPLSASGVPVTWFGAQGRLVTSVGRPAVARGVAPYADDIIVAGTVGVGPDADVLLARYDNRGTLKPDYGNGSVVIADVSGEADGINAVAVDPSLAVPGRHLTVGRGGVAVLVARYLRRSTGRQLPGRWPDASRAHSGRRRRQRLAVRPAAGIVLAGTAGSSGFARVVPMKDRHSGLREDPPGLGASMTSLISVSRAQPT